jgi:tRNA (uracil-5-)-methyltransferase TRM9
MNLRAARRLVRLNAEFYQTFAAEFAEARTALQPGIRRALAAIASARSVLDLGCGDGRVPQTLAGQDWAGDYLGVDASAALLERARARDLGGVRAEFRQADLATALWAARLPRQQFDAALLLAVLHHIPGAYWRTRLLRQAGSLLAPGGWLVISTWQFLDSARLREKIVPWEHAGLRATDVGPEDYLLDWRRGGEGLRYAAALDEAALRGLAEAAGLRVEETYRSDGRTGTLSMYAVLRKPLTIRLPKS